MLAPLLHPAPRSGKGDHPAQQGGPPPPHFVRGRIKRNRSRDAFMRPSFANHDDAKNRFASGNKKREAERRKAHANHRRHADKCVVCAARLRSGRQRALSGRARLPALCGGTRQGERIAVGSAPVPAFPETRSRGRYPLRSVTSLPRSAETGRSAGRAVAQSRPGADGKSARRHRPRSAFQACLSGKAPSMSDVADT